MKSLVVTLIIVIGFAACDQKQNKASLPVKSKKEYRELMIESHKAYLKSERKKLDEYVQNSTMDFQKTGSGLLYNIYGHSKSNDSIRKGDIAKLKYTLTLLNGDTAYQTLDGEYQEFIVALDDVESGLHEAVLMMAIGDTATFILPAHLAHGISGDQNKIPPQSPLVYHLELIGKR